LFSTNAGNLRLLLADLLEEPSDISSLMSSKNKAKAESKESNFAVDPELETTV
jgi:hypothetical protein